MTQAVQQNGQSTTRVLVTLAHPAEYRIVPEAGGLRVVLATAEKTAPMGAKAPRAARGRRDGPRRRRRALRPPARLRSRRRRALGPRRLHPEPGRRQDDGGDLRRAPPRRPPAQARHHGLRRPGAGRLHLPAQEPPGSRRRRGRARRRRLGHRHARGQQSRRPGGQGQAPDRASPASRRTAASRAARAPWPARRTSRAGAPRVDDDLRRRGRRAGVDGRARPGRRLPPDAFAGQQRRYTGQRINIDLKDAAIHEVLRLLVGRRPREHRHRRQRERHRHHPHAQRPLGPGARRGAPGQGPRHGAPGQHDPRRAARRSQQGARARHRPPQGRAPARARRDAAHPGLLRRGREHAGARQGAALAARLDRGRRAHQRPHRARRRRQPRTHIDELIRSLDTQTPQVLIEARIVEATSQYLARRRHPVGRRRHLQRRRRATRRASPSRPTIGVAGGASDQTTPTAGLSPFTNTVPNPNFAVNLPATVGTGQGGALGLTLGSINNTFNLGAPPLGRRVERHAAHHLEPAHPHARQPRGAHRPGHAHPVLAGQRPGRADHLPGGQAPAPRQAARHGRRQRRDAREDQPRRARLQPDLARAATRPSSSARPRPTCSSWTATPRSSAASTRATPAATSTQIPFFGDIPILGVLFQRRRASDARSELVIFLTPRIVNRAEALGR